MCVQYKMEPSVNFQGEMVIVIEHETTIQWTDGESIIKHPQLYN